MTVFTVFAARRNALWSVERFLADRQKQSGESGKREAVESVIQATQESIEECARVLMQPSRHYKSMK